MSDDDAALYRRLVDALNRGDLQLGFRFNALIAPSSPAFRLGEALFLIGVLAALALVPQFVGVAGYSNVVLAGLAMVGLVWGRWLWQRIKHRATKLGIESLENWEALWRRGAFELAPAGRRRGDVCIAPTGDWRAFVRRHLIAKVGPT